MVSAPTAPALADSSSSLDINALLSVLGKVKGGDFSARLPLDWTGVAGKLADGINEVISYNQALETELARVSQVVGKDGRFSQRAALGGRWSARSTRSTA